MAETIKPTRQRGQRVATVKRGEHIRLRTAWAMTVLAVIGCAGPSLAEGPTIVSISNPPVFKPKSPSEIKTVEQAMAAVITVTRDDLGLPVVEPLYLHLHKDTEAFAANAGYSGRRLPAAVVQFALAVAEENRFHINMEKLRNRPWGAVIWTLAHEYAHNVEYAMSSLNRGSQWIREGFADWVAAKVVDHLRWQDYGSTLQRAKLEVARQSGSLPAFSEIEDSRGWSVWANGPKGHISTYRFAFVAVDQLIASRGLAGIQKYFSTQDFATSFGISWTQFEKDFRSSIGATPPVGRTVAKVEKPEWKVGYEWQYAWKMPGRSGTLVRKLIRQDEFEGVPAYVIVAGKNESFYSRGSLGLLATASQGKLMTKRTVAHEFFSWPLELGKEWKTAYVFENLDRKLSNPLVYFNVVGAVEEIKVQARTFNAYKIETYAADRGSLVYERWYAPEAKWFVKTRDYLQDGLREEELTSFKLE